MTERLFVRDRVQIDSTKIEEYEHDIFGLVTVFKDVVIAREIVHEYTDGMAWKPANELKESFWTAEGRWAKAGDHPTEGIIMDRNSINGRTVNLRFTKSLMDPKTQRPDNRGILANLEVFNRTVPAQLLQDMKSGKASDVSIGFFFSKDGTAGVIDDGALKGTPYDYVQRNLSIDHVAYGLDAGRCPMPYCGIGADKLIPAGDPFAGYETFEECVRDIMKENPDYTRKQAEGTCAVIEQRSKEKHKSDATISKRMNETLEEVKVYLKDILSKLDAIEPAEEIELEGSDEEKIREDAGPRTEAERAMAHFNISEEAWESLSPEEKQEYIDKLPTKGSAVESADEDGEDEECLDCDDEVVKDSITYPVDVVTSFDVEASKKVTERTKAKLKELDIK